MFQVRDRSQTKYPLMTLSLIREQVERRRAEKRELWIKWIYVKFARFIVEFAPFIIHYQSLDILCLIMNQSLFFHQRKLLLIDTIARERRRMRANNMRRKNLGGNSTLPEPARLEQGNGEQKEEDIVMNKISPNDEPRSNKVHEYSSPTATQEPDVEHKEKGIKFGYQDKEGNTSGKEQRTYSSPTMNSRRKDSLVSILEALALLFDSCLNWSFCTFVLVLYHVTQVNRCSIRDRSRRNQNQVSEERPKSRVSGDFIRAREAVKGENEEQDLNESSTHQILSEILMKVQLMDVKSEIVVNGLLRILFIWKSLIREVITTQSQEQNEAESINQDELLNRDDTQLDLVEDEGMFGQSILDTSDSHLVPDFSSSEDENEQEMQTEVESPGSYLEYETE